MIFIQNDFTFTCFQVKLFSISYFLQSYSFIFSSLILFFWTTKYTSVIIYQIDNTGKFMKINFKNFKFLFPFKKHELSLNHIRTQIQLSNKKSWNMLVDFHKKIRIEINVALGMIIFKNEEVIPLY